MMMTLELREREREIYHVKKNVAIIMNVCCFSMSRDSIPSFVLLVCYQDNRFCSTEPSLHSQNEPYFPTWSLTIINMVLDSISKYFEIFLP